MGEDNNTNPDDKKVVSLLDYSEKITKFYLIRHGSTEATDKGLVCGHMDVDLTPEGLSEVEAVGDWFSQVPVDAIFTSPLKRAVQTANVVAKFSNIPTYYKHSGLIEKKEGDWDGKTYWEIRDKEPKLWAKWSKDPIGFTPPGGESVKDFYQRVDRALQDLRNNYSKMGNKVALVTHAGVIRAIIMHALKIPVENYFRIEVPPGSISRVDWSDNFATLKFCGLNPLVHETSVI